jgi:hypothetical protein
MTLGPRAPWHPPNADVGMPFHTSELQRLSAKAALPVEPDHTPRTLPTWGKAMAASHMSDEHGTERLYFSLAPELVAMIDDFRFRNRIPTRADAIRTLLRLGLQAVEKENPPPAN